MSSMSRLPFRPVPLTLLLKKPVSSEQNSPTSTSYTNDKMAVSSLLSPIPLPVLSPISSVPSPSRTSSPFLSPDPTPKRKQRSWTKPPVSSRSISKPKRRDPAPMNIEELTYYPVVRSRQQHTRTKCQQSKLKSMKTKGVLVVHDGDESESDGHLRSKEDCQIFERDVMKQHQNRNAGQEQEHYNHEHGHGHRRHYIIEDGDEGSKKTNYMDSGRNWSANSKVDNGHEVFIPLKKRYMFNHLSSSTNSSGSSID